MMMMNALTVHILRRNTVDFYRESENYIFIMLYIYILLINTINGVASFKILAKKKIFQIAHFVFYRCYFIFKFQMNF